MATTTRTPAMPDDEPTRHLRRGIIRIANEPETWEHGVCEGPNRDGTHHCLRCREISEELIEAARRVGAEVIAAGLEEQLTEWKGGAA